jgi:hypothetical protein
MFIVMTLYKAYYKVSGSLICVEWPLRSKIFGIFPCGLWKKNVFFCLKDIGRRPVSDFKRMRLPIFLWVVRYFGILLVFNVVILLEIYLLSFLKCFHANFIFAFLLSQLK